MTTQRDYHECWIGTPYVGYNVITRWNEAVRDGCVALTISHYSEHGNTTTTLYLTPAQVASVVANLNSAVADGGAR